MIGWLLFLITLPLLGTAIFYLIRFARIILLVEDEISDAIAVHERTVQTLDALLASPMYSDSPAINQSIRNALDDVTICRAATHRIVDSFTRFSDKQYERIEYETKDNG